MLIEINEKSYDLHFGMKALEIFYKTAGVVDGESLFHAEQITAIVWGGLQNGAYRQQKSLDLTFADVCDYVEGLFFGDEGQKTLSEVVAAFNESQAVKNMAKMAQEDTKKKKKPTSQKQGSSLSVA